MRVDGEDAVFGITWFAQDALGEIVYARPARRGRRGSPAAPRTASSSRSRPSPTSSRRSRGEVVEVNDDAAGRASARQRRSLRRGLDRARAHERRPASSTTSWTRTPTGRFLTRPDRGASAVARRPCREVVGDGLRAPL